MILGLSFNIIGVYALLCEAPACLDAFADDKPLMSVEKINLPQDALIKTYGFPIAMVAARLVKDQPNRIIAHTNGNVGINTSFIENRKLKQIREDIVKNHQGPVVVLISYNIQGEDAKFFSNAIWRKRELEKEGMYCRPLQSYAEIVDICVTKS